MKVIKGRVDWFEGRANRPRIELLVDRIPRLEELRYRYNHGLWYGELDGYVSFFSWTGPSNEGGYGGRAFKLKTVDGDDVTLLGPWSSNSMDMNRVGFGPCLEASVIEEPAGFERGYTFMAGAVTLDLLRRSLDVIEWPRKYTDRPGTGTEGQSMSFPAGSHLEIVGVREEGRTPGDGRLSAEQRLPVFKRRIEVGDDRSSRFEPAVVIPGAGQYGLDATWIKPY